MNPATADPVRTLRILAIALGIQPLVILAAVTPVMPFDVDDEPTVPVVVGLIAVVTAGFAIAEAVGFRTPTLPISADDHTPTSLERFQTLMLVRFSITEAPLIIGLATMFVLDEGLWPFLVTVTVGLPALWFETYPTRRNVDRLASRLEASGARSGLREAFGHR